MNIPNEFTTLNEVANFTSKNYSEFNFKKIKKLKNRFFNENGKFLKYCHIFKHILHLRYFENKIKKTIIMGIIVKIPSLLKISNSLNIIEIWMSSIKNFFKRTSFILVKGEGEIWEFNFVKKNVKKKNLIKIIFLFGTSFWIVDIPPLFPQFFEIKKPFFRINLANSFNWKMCLSKNLIISGDISGKITIFDTNKNLKINQFTHNTEKICPIGDLTLLESIQRERKILIVGGYDGVLKIWSILKKIVPLKEIHFNKRWLVKLSAHQFDENFILISANFENGFFGLIWFNDKIKILKSFLNQGSSLLNHYLPNYIISAGNDGYINSIEFNSPKFDHIDYLNLMDNPSFLFNLGFKSKINNTLIQSTGIKFQINNINFKKVNFDKKYFYVSGFWGIILQINLFNDHI
jgi:WD40 repeat protein